ncbi:MobQ family relaxase [Sphingomonas sp.]|uniref:MobQ family relaxase n=1 Tax=Sphingomonas sp. TaxID=28214 RepID=UPI001B250125|nr:MobQ family relaxase [Sphingomonas sp.]MBO9712636.1 MobA/MobL family protein [Sphingomonas sp.]
MALFSMRMQVLSRSKSRSSVAAAAYRSGEKLRDDRQGITHDYRNRGGVEHTEILLPAGAPAWVQGIDRERLWNAVEAGEKRKDSQTARELRIMIPRELPPEERINVVRDFVLKSFVAKGMVADICWHNKISDTDGREQPHAHVMLTMRPLVADGFGQKVRHDWVPDPSGRLHPDGRPVMVVSNAQSWNCPDYYERCREAWENTANAALARAGSDQRIDRRSYLERGLSRLPEPALRLAFHLKELYGVMKERFGQFQRARHYRAVESRAKAAFAKLDASPMTPDAARQAKDTAERFFAWIERQQERLGPAGMEHARAGPNQTHGGAMPNAGPDRDASRSPPTSDLER